MQKPPTSPDGRPLSPGRQVRPLAQVQGNAVFPPQCSPRPETQPASRSRVGTQNPPTSPLGKVVAKEHTRPLAQVQGEAVFPPQGPRGPETQPASIRSGTQRQRTGSG